MACMRLEYFPFSLVAHGLTPCCDPAHWLQSESDGEGPPGQRTQCHCNSAAKGSLILSRAFRSKFGLKSLRRYKRGGFA